jgi:hypothetical protein
MIKYFLQIHIPYLKENMETIAAFSSGSILTLGYWLAIDPTAIMGKIIMSAVLGLAGGLGGLLAKAICNKVTRYFKNRNRKS